jgi:hypothetical protein
VKETVVNIQVNKEQQSIPGLGHGNHEEVSHQAPEILQVTAIDLSGFFQKRKTERKYHDVVQKAELDRGIQSGKTCNEEDQNKYGRKKEAVSHSQQEVPVDCANVIE